MSVQVTPEQMEVLRATLLNTSGKVELHERFRALFMLKAVGGDEVIRVVAEGESPARRWAGQRVCSRSVLCISLETLLVARYQESVQASVRELCQYVAEANG